TGVAGALWVPLNGLTTPDILHWTFSGKIVFMAVLGGFRTFVGPIVGAVVYNYLESYAVGYTVYWQLFLGVVLVVLVLSLPTGIARSFQLVNLFDQLSALDNVALAIFSRQGKTRRLLTLADADRPVWAEATEVLSLFRLDAKARTLAGGLSQGERKLLDVAIAYALKPRLLFLDEPTSGVGTREKAPIMDTIVSIVRSEGISAAIIEHD